VEGVAGDFSWRPVLIRLHSVTSTQDWVRDWAEMGAQEGLILIAREQTAGRGRLARSWESPRGGLYLSLLLRPPIPLARANQLTMLVSLAAIDACRQVAGLQANPKWPNDLLLKDKKNESFLFLLRFIM
jgi:BirA family biotin operon repressor/biotin-[acetyl-CoA-carboxylase] ligase